MRGDPHGMDGEGLIYEFNGVCVGEVIEGAGVDLVLLGGGEPFYRVRRRTNHTATNLE